MKFASAVLFTLAAAFLAGCTTGNDSGPEATPNPSATFGSDAGGIEGIVTDPELRPVDGAQVGLEDPRVLTSTDAGGRFAFDNLPPGDYVVLVNKLGYNAATKTAHVEAGEATTITVELAPLTIVEPRAQVYQFTGFITCSIGYAVVLSEECGAGLGTPVGRYGTDANNNIDWVFQVENTPDFANLQVMFLELDWTPASAAASQLGFNVAHGFTCEPSCEADTTFCEVFENYGPPVVTCSVGVDKLGVEDPEEDLPYDITARAWAAPSGETEAPNIVLQQPFTMYRTDFYGQGVPADYSATPDA